MTETKAGADTLIRVLQNRQKRIIASLPSFAKATVPLAAAGFLISFLVRLFTDEALRSGIASEFGSLTLGSVISIVLGLFSSLVLWLFVVWSLLFVPYIAIQAHKASREADTSLDTKPLRWVQLYAATFLPMAIFATAWNSFASDTRPTISIKITSILDLSILLAGTGLVVVLISGINHWIPVRLAAIRLSFLSLLLYISLFLSYGRGIGMASHAMVFGILTYMLFGSGQFGDLFRRISLHDVDPKLAERFDEIVVRHQELRSLQDETELKKREHEAEMAKHQLELSTSQAESEVALSQQLAEIKKRKVLLNRDMNEVQLKVLETKIDTLGEVFGILSDEMNSRMSSDIPSRLKELRENVKAYTPEEIQRRMNDIMGQINSSLQGIPETLAELRVQLIAAASELEKQTRLLTDEAKGEDRNG